MMHGYALQSNVHSPGQEAAAHPCKVRTLNTAIRAQVLVQCMAQLRELWQLDQQLLHSMCHCRAAFAPAYRVSKSLMQPQPVCRLPCQPQLNAVCMQWQFRHVTGHVDLRVLCTQQHIGISNNNNNNNPPSCPLASVWGCAALFAQS
jgi:hypothetical protein